MPYLMWNKVKNVVGEGSTQIDLAQECRSVELYAEVSEIGRGQYEIRLINNGNKNVWAKLVLFNTNSYSEVLDFGGYVPALTPKTKTLDFEIIGANKIEVTPYFINEFGEESICPTTMSVDI